MDITQISLDLSNKSQHTDLGIELWLDQCKFFDHVIGTGSHHVVHEFEEQDGPHALHIVLKNKLAAHTQIDDQGHIISDAVINVNNIKIDGIDITQIVYQLSQYIHDTNGKNTMAVHQFYGDLGCNGKVELNFTAPVYLWMLENI